MRVLCAGLPKYFHGGGSDNVPGFLSLTGGDQRLALVHCPECKGNLGYSLRRGEGPAEMVGGDAEIVSAAIHSLLGQLVEVFTVVVERDGKEWLVLPRAHLPSFLVGGRRG